jgi:Uri superfamily endonuclease
VKLRHAIARAVLAGISPGAAVVEPGSAPPRSIARPTRAPLPPPLPHQPGTYALLLRARYAATVEVGRLGRLRVLPGVYVYVGSAMGPGGVAGRLAHHLRHVASPHWHVDYLRIVAEPIEAWYTLDRSASEHGWAAVFHRALDGQVGLRRFGASDCRCPAHLFYFTVAPQVADFAARAECTV